MTFRINISCSLLFLLICLYGCNDRNPPLPSYNVVVLGEGIGAISAAIQSARSGASTLLVNPLPWVGGMTTSAGVSATDGNNMMPSGLWGEWRHLIHNHYGGPDSVFTGWVSNTMYEPHIGEKYWRQIAQVETNLTIQDTTNWDDIKWTHDKWEITLSNDQIISGQVIIDGTDLGDVAAQVGASFSIGMDAQSNTGESMAPIQSNDIIQDLTYAAILKDYGENVDMTIPRPRDYQASEFHCSCQHECDDPEAHPCSTMLSYGKLPNKKYMINWPIKGNDYYANIITATKESRDLEFEKAKQKTLRFVYYIQTELGYKNFALADDEFPTKDKLPLMPYHREGRRINGIVQTTINHLKDPYATNLYRTGVAVGDYPVDHHHFERPDAPDIEFPPIPSFNIPLGSLIPKNIDNLIIADKAISVSNIANGSTRLQPVVIQIGQAAGQLAAKSVELDLPTSKVPIREVQEALLKSKGYVMPYYDVKQDDKDFEAIQKIGATGILKGEGRPFKWANQSWFYPDSIVNTTALTKDLSNFEPRLASFAFTDKNLSSNDFSRLLDDWLVLINKPSANIKNNLKSLDAGVSRRDFCSILNNLIDPFGLKEMDHKGNLIEDTHL